MATPDPKNPNFYLVTPGVAVPWIEPGQRWRSCEEQRRSGRERIETVENVDANISGDLMVTWAKRPGERAPLAVRARALHLDGKARATGWVFVSYQTLQPRAPVPHLPPTVP